MNENDKVEIEGTFAGYLALTELGWGSLLHAWHLPFTGTLLSCNQIFLLAKASISTGGIRGFSSTRISIIAALYKGLTPIGKRITPMVAIAMQGILFNFGECLLGKNRLGRSLGAAMASLWGILQPLLLYYMILGEAFFKAAAALVREVNNWLGWEENRILLLLFFFVLLKIAAGVLSCWAASWLSEFRYQRYLHVLSAQKRSLDDSSSSSKIMGAVYDLMKPSFLLALMGSAAFVYLTSNFIVSLIYLFQALCCGFLSFIALRLITAQQVKSWLQSLRQDRPV